MDDDEAILDDLTLLELEKVRIHTAWKNHHGPRTFEKKISQTAWQAKFDQGVQQYLEYLKSGKAFDFSSYPQTINRSALRHVAGKLLRQEQKQEKLAITHWVKEASKRPYQFWLLLCILLSLLSMKPLVAFRENERPKTTLKGD